MNIRDYILNKFNDPNEIKKAVVRSVVEQDKLLEKYKSLSIK